MGSDIICDSSSVDPGGAEEVFYKRAQVRSPDRDDAPKEGAWRTSSFATEVTYLIKLFLGLKGLIVEEPGF
jgi:hypothetical protein